MKYGLELANAGACGDARTLGELAALAEEAGWDGIFLEDYIVHWSGFSAGHYGSTKCLRPVPSGAESMKTHECRYHMHIFVCLRGS